ncbi:MAG: glycosyltransferase [Thermoleophilia bacterium]|nr:glycosyltransferase [Thermoleophilia bacterium]
MVSPTLTDRTLNVSLAVAFALCSASGHRVSFRRRTREGLPPKGAQNLRVAVIYHFFPHYRKGVMEELRQTADVTFVGDRDGAEGGVPCLAFPEDARFVQARCYRVGPFVLQPKVVWLALTGRYDVFVYLANPYFLATWCAALICRLRGRRVVFWGHGFLSEKERLKNLTRALFYSLAHAFYSYGYRSKQIARRYRFGAENLHVGFNSLDYRAQLPLREQCLSRPDPEDDPAAWGDAAAAETPRDGAAAPNGTAARRPLRIVCLSRLTGNCRYDLLLRAVAEARDAAGLATSLLFIGDGPARAGLETLAADLGVSARFVGELYDEAAIAPLVYSADVTVSPGKVGLTAVHSMMFGAPVVTHSDLDTQMPEVETIVEGRTGMLFNRDDEHDLARVLAGFGDAFPDRERARRDCFAVVDRLYNPAHQVEVLMAAVTGGPAEEGDDMLRLFTPGDTDAAA